MIMDLPLQSLTWLKYLLPDNTICKSTRNSEEVLGNGTYSLWGSHKYEPRARSGSRKIICTYHIGGFLFTHSHFLSWFKISFYYGTKMEKNGFKWRQIFICGWVYEPDPSESTWNTQKLRLLFWVVWWCTLLHPLSLKGSYKLCVPLQLMWPSSIFLIWNETIIHL